MAPTAPASRIVYAAFHGTFPNTCLDARLPSDMHAYATLAVEAATGRDIRDCPEFLPAVADLCERGWALVFERDRGEAQACVDAMGEW